MDIESALREPEVRKALTKVAFANEWATSLRESHPDSEARNVALESFDAEVSFIRREIEAIFGGISSVESSRNERTAWI